MPCLGATRRTRNDLLSLHAWGLWIFSQICFFWFLPPLTECIGRKLRDIASFGIRKKARVRAMLFPQRTTGVREGLAIDCSNYGAPNRTRFPWFNSSQHLHHHNVWETLLASSWYGVGLGVWETGLSVNNFPGAPSPPPSIIRAHAYVVHQYEIYREVNW